MFQGGYLRAFSFRDAPVRFHWTLLVGLLMFSRLQWAPGAWLGFVAIVLLHEIGHAILVRRYGLRVLGIDVHGLGGVCRHTGGATIYQSSVIAWGGVLAQSILLVLALLLLQVIPFARHSLFALELFDTLVWTNLIIIGINLLPLPGFDGALAWKLPGMLWRRQGPTRPEATRMRERDLIAPPERFPVRARARKAPVPVDEADPPPLAPDVKAEMERIIRQAVKERVDKSRN